MYIDESYGSKSKYVVLSGYIIKDSDWRSIDNSIRKLKKDLFDDESYNLKNIRRNKHEKNKLWQNLSDVKKQEFNTRFYEIIKNNATLITTLINKENMDYKNKPFYFQLAYSFLLQRFQYFLQEKSQNGFVVMDQAECSEEVKGLYSYHSSLLQEGIPIKPTTIQLKIGDATVSLKDYVRQKVNYIFENVFFDDDETNNMLQIADMVAAGISSKYNHGTDRYFKLIEPILRKSKEGKVEGYGLKIFPEKSSKDTQ